MYLYFLNLIFFFVIRPKTPQPIELSSCAWCALGSFPWRLPHLVSSALVLFPHGAAKREIRIFFYFERERLFGVILSMARWWLEAQTCIHNLYKSCGEPSLLDQCAQYNFGPCVIYTIKIAHRRTLLDGLLAALGITEGKSLNLHKKYAENILSLLLSFACKK